MREGQSTLWRGNSILAINLGLTYKPRDFEKAIRGELPVLYRVARQMVRSSDEAEELVQRTLVSAFRGWERFDGRKLRAWLLRILTHENLARFRGPEAPASLEDIEGLEPSRDDLWDTVLNRDQVSCILRNLEKLEPHYRIVIQLCDVEGMTYEEVAEVIEVPIGTVRSRLFRGRNQLRELVLAEGGADYV
jgi:RNA polymerase sigma-70 factor (ECF subfamily)